MEEFAEKIYANECVASSLAGHCLAAMVCDRSDGMLRTLHLVGMPAVGTASALNLAAHHSDRCSSTACHNVWIDVMAAGGNRCLDGSLGLSRFLVQSSSMHDEA